MKIAYITPGSGEMFYCQNCFRDSALLHSLIELGHDVVRVPLYLPSRVSDMEKIAATPVFYGAINVFLKEKLPIYRHAPAWMERLLDSSPLLNAAARKSGSTRAAGLEEMTISMLKGEEGHQATELNHLIRHLKQEVRPDVVHLSNSLLLGLARRIKNDLGAGIVCSLQDENEWVDLMEENYQNRVWELMAEKASDVDIFVTASRYYADLSERRLQIPPSKIQVVYGGIALEGYEPSPLSVDPPVIGYLCRLSEYFGFGILVDAFLRIKDNSPFQNLKLYATGGYSQDDKPFVDSQIRKIADHGFADDFLLVKDFCKEGRIRFLKSLTLLSVPVPSGEAFGAYQVEALASGVPVIQPNVGCYPEFIAMTGGGVVFEPNTGLELARAIISLLSDPDRLRKFGREGKKAVQERFSMERMAKDIAEIYHNVT